eukprot:TRINITY_DN19_c6_g1_i10.p2 TRINITY_DN19_c6_g1~~TRINITY_DN19_c6_g1_i10.p2  ORF type:complete len:282 (-),score=-8.75 TRINITY_DN19_c6_g1_i10:4-849(-)
MQRRRRPQRRHKNRGDNIARMNETEAPHACLLSVCERGPRKTNFKKSVREKEPFRKRICKKQKSVSHYCLFVSHLKKKIKEITLQKKEKIQKVFKSFQKLTNYLWLERCFSVLCVIFDQKPKFKVSYLINKFLSSYSKEIGQKPPTDWVSKANSGSQQPQKNFGRHMVCFKFSLLSYQYIKLLLIELNLSFQEILYDVLLLRFYYKLHKNFYQQNKSKIEKTQIAKYFQNNFQKCGLTDFKSIFTSFQFLNITSQQIFDFSVKKGEFIAQLCFQLKIKKRK